MRLKAIVSLVFVVFAAEAHGHCIIDQFDATEPRSIKGQVREELFHFEWATDVDIRHDRSWAWHYILNQHLQNSWTGFWEKAEITVPLSRPLPPGRPFCRQIFLGKHREDPDTNAPIIYGANSQKQPAAVFVSSNTKLSSIEAGVVIETTIVLRDKSTHDLHLHVSLVPKGAGKYQFSLSGDLPEMVIGLSGLQAVFSSNQYKELLTIASKSGMKATTDTLTKFAGSKASEELFPFAPTRADEAFTFFVGKRTELFYMFEPKSTQPSELVIVDFVALDSFASPILATRLQVPSVR